MPIRHLLVDLAGVVCQFDRAARLVALAEAAGTDPASVEGQIYGSGLSDRFDRGEFSSPEICAVLRETLRLDPVLADDAALARWWGRAFTPDEEVLALIDRVRPDVTRSLLTNNDALLRDHMSQVLSPVHVRFALPLFSSLLGATKPDPASYLSALTLLGARAGEAFFVDDSPENVAGAAQVGITAVLFTDPATLEQDLNAAGLLDLAAQPAAPSASLTPSACCHSGPASNDYGAS